VLPPDAEPPGCERLSSRYQGVDVHALYANGIDLSNVRFQCFRNVQINTDPGTGDEYQDFDATLVGTLDNGTGPQWVSFSGPVTIVVRGKAGFPTGSWQAEILSMDLAATVGGIPMQVRESPSLRSLGQISVTDLGGGQWLIESFFDVFNELSIAGGPFEPSVSGPGRITLKRVRRAPPFSAPTLPPESNPADCGALTSQYASGDVHALFSAGIDFSNSRYKCFTNVQTTLHPPTGDETSTYDVIVDTLADDGSGPTAVTLTGQMTTVTRDKGIDTTGTWDTEIVSMSLTGALGATPIELRQSPGLQSLGQTTVTDAGNGEWEIDSFFDVFTELSISGGPFQPQTNPEARITLERIHPIVTLDSSDLPPESDPPDCGDLDSGYARSGVHGVYPGLELRDVHYECFTNVQRTIDPGTGDEIAVFDAVLEGVMDDGGAGQPVSLAGSMTTATRGTFGAIPIGIRESPSVESTGETTVADLGGGQWEVDGFFDVFTEISVNGGPFQLQTNDPRFIELAPASSTSPPQVPAMGPLGVVALAASLLGTGGLIAHRKAGISFPRSRDGSQTQASHECQN